MRSSITSMLLLAAVMWVSVDFVRLSSTFVGISLLAAQSRPSLITRKMWSDGDKFAPPGDVKSPPWDVKKTASGIQWKSVRKGDGEGVKTKEDSIVELVYTSWEQETGELVDCTLIRPEPTKIAVKDLNPGLKEIVLQMEEDESRRIWIPAELAETESGRFFGGRGALHYNLELKRVAAPALDPIFAFFLTVGLILSLLTYLQATLSDGPVRREYETSGPFSFISLSSEETELKKGEKNEKTYFGFIPQKIKLPKLF